MRDEILRDEILRDEKICERATRCPQLKSRLLKSR